MSQIADSSFDGEVLVFSFLSTAVLVALHLAAPYIRRSPWLARKGFTSFSGGFAVAYVFLHMLPGLVESKDAIGEILHSHFVGSHFVEISVFLLAFLGFMFFFGLKRWCRQESDKSQKEIHRSFVISIASFSVYNVIITYTMPERIMIDVMVAGIFTLAVALHMMMIDAEHEAHEATHFNKWGRYVLSGALLFGWVLGVTLGEHNLVTAAFLSSFLGGALLLNVFHYELSEVRDSSFGAFLFGAVCGAGILLLVFYIESGIELHS